MTSIKESLVFDGLDLNGGFQPPPFDPSTIAGLKLWVKADAGTSTTTDGVAVSQWNDQSSSAWHLTQGTGANQPLYKTAIQNSLPGILFDGSNDSMVNTSVSVAQPDTIFIVCKNTESGGVLRALFDGATTRQHIYRQTDDAMHVYASNDNTTTFTFGTTNAHQISLVLNGASSGLWVDAAAFAVGNPGANSLVSFLLGTNSVASSWWKGYVFEFLIYNSSLSTTDRQNVEAYLKTRWGTP